MTEEIWTLDYEAEGAQVEDLKQAMHDFLPELVAEKRIQQMNVMFIREGNPFLMRVDIAISGNPFDPPWPNIFRETQIGQPKVFFIQPALSIAKR